MSDCPTSSPVTPEPSTDCRPLDAVSPTLPVRFSTRKLMEHIYTIAGFEIMEVEYLFRHGLHNPARNVNFYLITPSMNFYHDQDEFAYGAVATLQTQACYLI